MVRPSCTIEVVENEGSAKAAPMGGMWYTSEVAENERIFDFCT